MTSSTLGIRKKLQELRNGTNPPRFNTSHHLTDEGHRRHNRSHMVNSINRLGNEGCESDADESEMTSLRSCLRDSEREGLSDDVPPRPVDKELIRKYLRHELPPELYHEVGGLIADYRLWHDAEREIFLTEPEQTNPAGVGEDEKQDKH